jgi:peptide chain release factor subunit 1
MLVAILNAELVKRLVRYEGSDRPVTTLYLNVDGRENIRPEDYRHRLETMVKEALSKESDETRIKFIESDLARISHFVNDEFERNNTRGLAVFACGDDLWQTIELTLPVEDHLVVNRTPHVRILETLLDEYETIGVLITDKQKARLLVIELGRIVEREEVVDPVPRHDDDKGDWEKDHVRDHSAAIASQHMRNAATAMFDLYQRCHFEHLVVFVADELKDELCKNLHDYLKQRKVGRGNLPLNTSDHEIVNASHGLVQKWKRNRENEDVSRLRAALAINDVARRSSGELVGAVVGLEDTLQAIYEKRVETLLVSAGFTAEGWRCPGCNCIATVGRRCRVCGDEMTLVDDVVEEAVEDAIGQKCRVEFCSDNADLDVMGRIGALLRF